MERIAFDYEKYLTGDFRAVTRDGREVTGLTGINHRNGYPDKLHYGKVEGKGKTWSPNGAWSYRESPLDLFLIPISKEGDKEERKFSKTDMINFAANFVYHATNHTYGSEEAARNHVTEYINSLTNDK